MQLNNTKEIIIIGYERITGKSDKCKTGEYDITRFYFTEPIREDRRENRSFTGRKGGSFTLTGDARDGLVKELTNAGELNARVSGYYDKQFNYCITGLSTDFE